MCTQKFCKFALYDPIIFRVQCIVGRVVYEKRHEREKNVLAFPLFTTTKIQTMFRACVSLNLLLWLCLLTAVMSSPQVSSARDEKRPRRYLAKEDRKQRNKDEKKQKKDKDTDVFAPQVFENPETDQPTGTPTPNPTSVPTATPNDTPQSTCVVGVEEDYPECTFTASFDCRTNDAPSEQCNDITTCEVGKPVTIVWKVYNPECDQDITTVCDGFPGCFSGPELYPGCYSREIYATYSITECLADGEVEKLSFEANASLGDSVCFFRKTYCNPFRVADSVIASTMTDDDTCVDPSDGCRST
jgi:hypothetical protein